MATINNGSKQFIVCSIANVQQSLIGCTSVAKADRPAQKGLESASISHVGESPPGWRRVAEFGYDDVCMYSDNLHIAAYATSRFKAALHSSNIDVFS
jgi:hypothetical protein